MDDVNVDFEQHGKLVHTFWEGPAFNLSIIFVYLGNSLTTLMSFHTTLLDTTHSFFSEVF
jgi:hypothetical protein